MGSSQPIEVPAIAVIDDGELEDVRELLEELGADFVHGPKASVPETCRLPRRLLLTTASHAISLGYARSGRRRPDQPTWLCVLEGDLRQQSRKLLQAGFDFLIRRPVHPQALRLLLQAALYQGREQRRGNRVAVGFSISYRVGWRRHPATLVDISGGGCRILARRVLGAGTPVSVRLPGHIAGGRVFRVKGQVARCRRGEIEGGGPEEFSLGIRFAELSARTEKQLGHLLGVLRSGPPVLSEPLPRTETPTDTDVPELEQQDPLLDAANAPDAADAAPAEPPLTPRRSPRGRYRERVLVFGDADRVLIGRDLSRGGMRVDPTTAISTGEQIRIAIEGGPGIEAVVVSASVTRDDGDRGLALRFESIEPDGEQRLEEIVRSLPAIEAPGSDAASDAEGVVMAQVLPRVMRVIPQAHYRR